MKDGAEFDTTQATIFIPHARGLQVKAIETGVPQSQVTEDGYTRDAARAVQSRLR